MSTVLQELHGENRFFGLRIQHSFASLYTLDLVLDQIPVDRVVELGTFEGGLSAFLWLECLIRNKTFLSIDHEDRRRFTRFLFLRLDILRSPAAHSSLRKMLSRERTLLYCDNGDKPNEVRLFAPYLKEGSVLGVHDWGTEITYEDVKILKDLNYELLDDINKMCDELKTLQRFWIRK